MVAAYAAQLADAGYDVSIATAKCSSKFPLPPAIRLDLIPSRSPLKTLWLALARRQKADVVVADIIVLAFLLALRQRGRVLYFAQDYDEYYYRSWWMRFLIRGFYRVAIRILKVPTIAVSDYLADKLRSEFSGRVEVVRNSVDTDTFFPDKDLQLLSRKGGRKSLLILCRSDWRKGFSVAEAVVRRVDAVAHLPLEVWTVGERPPRPLCRFEQDFGYVDEDELRRLMSSADLFLYPSRHEGFGLMVLEALACGCPVVCTEGVPREVHGGVARVAKIDDIESLGREVECVLSDDPLRASLSRRGIDFVRSAQGEADVQTFTRAVELLMSGGV